MADLAATTRRKDVDTKNNKPTPTTPVTCPIVGIGASAGGLEALSALLKNVALDSMAFVVVQHLAPKHESFLPALLSRVSNIKVDVAADGTAVQPNRVYVIPPNADLAVLRGVLHVMTPPHDDGGHGSHRPVDYFFRSLAEDLGPRAIGIVLSGTGSDGTFGLKAIKEAGGITFAQDPGTAKYDGMPREGADRGPAGGDLGRQPAGDRDHLLLHGAARERIGALDSRQRGQASGGLSSRIVVTSCATSSGFLNDTGSSSSSSVARSR